MFSFAQVRALLVVPLSSSLLISAVCSLVQASPSRHGIIPGTAAAADGDKTPSSSLFFKHLQDQQDESWVLIQFLSRTILFFLVVLSDLIAKDGLIQYIIRALGKKLLEN